MSRSVPGFNRAATHDGVNSSGRARGRWGVEGVGHSRKRHEVGSLLSATSLCPLHTVAAHRLAPAYRACLDAAGWAALEPFGCRSCGARLKT